MILGAGVMQIPIIRKADALGYETIVADYDSNAPGRKYASKFYCVSTLDGNSILEIARREEIDGILTTSDAPVRIVAEVGSTLNLPVMPSETSRICTDKYLQRRILKESGVKCPEFMQFTPEDDISGWNIYPCIVKPVDSSASRGVRKAVNAEELNAAVNDAFRYSGRGAVIIESFIEGREFSVESFSQNGRTDIIAVTEKATTGGEFGYFVESMHLQPARITREELDLISREVCNAAQAVGLDNCPSHIEVKLNGAGAHIIEVACRLGGDYITSDLVPLSTGVDMLDNLIRVSVGEKIDTEKKFAKSSCVLFIVPENYEKCRRFIESGNCRMVRYEIHPFVDRPVRNSLDRLGHIIMQAGSIDEIENLLSDISNE